MGQIGTRVQGSLEKATEEEFVGLGFDGHRMESDIQFAFVDLKRSPITMVSRSG